MIEIYRPELQAEWDDAVRASRNGTFLHLRPYMDYHADRFEDFSMMARDAKGRVVAVLPAHRCGTMLCSHRGLTYGGWLMSRRADQEAMMDIWAEATAVARDNGMESMLYRPVPHIFHRYPAEEDLYALWRAGGRLQAVQASTAIDLSCPLGFDMAGRQSVRKAAAAGITVAESSDFAGFWNVLETCLAERHEARPVHTLAEIELLRSRFPENIRLFTATLDGRILAGVVLYISDTVAHSQYGATTAEGRAARALPLLYHSLIDMATAAGKRYFDFGTSCEDGGNILNTGLIRQKNGFGARTIAFPSYSIDL